jgi:hypothetical protein
MLMEDHITGVGFGTSGKPDFWIRYGVLGNATVHVAFAADDHTAVAAFHERAIAVEGATTAVAGNARVPSDLL